MKLLGCLSGGDSGVRSGKFGVVRWNGGDGGMRSREFVVLSELMGECA